MNLAELLYHIAAMTGAAAIGLGAAVALLAWIDKGGDKR